MITRFCIGASRVRVIREELLVTDTWWHAGLHRVVIAIGLALHAMGHLGLWLLITGRITLPYWQVCRTE